MGALIMGTGYAECAIACDWGHRGHSATLWAYEDHRRVFDILRAHGDVTVKKHVIVLTARIVFETAKAPFWSRVIESGDTAYVRNDGLKRRLEIDNRYEVPLDDRTLLQLLFPIPLGWFNALGYFLFSNQAIVHVPTMLGNMGPILPGGTYASIWSGRYEQFLIRSKMPIQNAWNSSRSLASNDRRPS
ncbi:hypothetical protein B0J13DRAFT_517302 [Dactylonectria estremocensis]|uniref:Uncharacterized protein n=1 Tax=Dactylonectria estremocensis TaxID=1079267 RepID=A0A9P9JHU5_9HYPO|nr:hypothetical protein B0J13DRAFT_517302 [Dactylonectria estremocensis]